MSKFCYRLFKFFLIKYIHQKKIGGEEGMTKNEYELQCENEKLKKQIKELKNKNKDLETQKKTFCNKLKIQSEQLELLSKENKIKDYKEIKRKYNIAIEEIKNLNKVISNKDSVIQALTARINKNSSNSSKPSSTDGFKKVIHNCRAKTGKKVGGQKNHKGTTLNKKKPIQIVEKKIEKCECGGDVVNSEDYKSKQLIDIEIKVNIIEERIFKGRCKKCGKVHKAKFSKEFKNPAQYGSNLKALISMLINEEYVAIDRCSKLIKEITGDEITLSNGTIVNITKELSRKSESSVEAIKAKLIEAPLAHADETGIRINGVQHWLHTLCNKDYVVYGINEKRGKDAIEEMELLSFFTGILMHDHFKPYYKYEQITHAECNAHILRYLKSVIDVFHRKETENFLEFLIKINNEKKEAIQNGKSSFETSRIVEIESEYKELLEKWKNAYYEYIKKLDTINKPLKEERCLFERLLEYQGEHLLFIRNFEVPFDNNMAERALRMIKTKKNVSGGFRSKSLAENFCNIRSLFGSARKQNKNIFQVAKQILDGKTIEFAKA